MSADRGVQSIADILQRFVSASARLFFLSVFFTGSFHGSRGSTIVSWGNNASLTNIPLSLTNAAAISAGAAHGLALLVNGTVVSWGSQTNVPASLSNIVAISAAGNANLALKEDGTLISWGTSSFGQTNIPATATNVIAISVGSSHCLALRHTGTLIAWGANNYNQTNVPAAATNLVSISAGGAHSAVLRQDGAILCWGNDNYRQVSGIPTNLTDVATVSAGGAHTLALHHDGSHSYWGVIVTLPSPGYTNAPTGFTNVVSVSAGSLHTTSLLSDGTVHTDGYPPTTSQPPGLSNVVAVAAAQGVAAFFLQNNISFSGGAYSLGIVGDGTIHSLPSPKNHTLSPGSFLLLNPMATGPQPLHYQWRLNDADLPGDAKPLFVIPKANRRNAGEYSVVISNASETVTSLVAHVSVIVRQRLEPGGMDEAGHFALWSGDEDGTELTTNDVSRFTLETSPDYLNWTSQTDTPSVTNGLLRFVDADAMSVSNRFYRVREVY